VYLVWTDALKVSSADWIEPAFRPAIDLDRYRIDAARWCRPKCTNPFTGSTPGSCSAEDAVLIAVIDEAYPEIRPGAVAVTRETLRRKVFPEVMEPVHLAGKERLK
jgi:hypothetical protein